VLFQPLADPGVYAIPKQARPHEVNGSRVVDGEVRIQRQDIHEMPVLLENLVDFAGSVDGAALSGLTEEMILNNFKCCPLIR